MLTATVSRVKQNTASTVNDAIRRHTEQSVFHIASGGRAAIDQRLAELDAEWDIERYLETMAPTFTLMGLTMGLTIDRRWFALPLIVQTFFLQHALQGWCPPIPVLRRLGVRTVEEINEERYALKALRGDFDTIEADPAAALRAARA